VVSGKRIKVNDKTQAHQDTLQFYSTMGVTNLSFFECILGDRVLSKDLVLGHTAFKDIPSSYARIIVY
jgi:hypothetical protein